MYSHGSSHSRGVMILFKPRLDVDLEKIAADNFGRCILAETIIDGTKIVLVIFTHQMTQPNKLCSLGTFQKNL